ncbi:uncharacterized protein PAC_15127 [Phialocephala subalpina]|uniref:Helicase-like transcription factor protein n=1 Tax=Phialocephala subalpina TaxID=576137 RepID=A0A1L7XJU3_9HELO|nr:uncharacterized protein PAC_15127 [Phialocephala subalpina]
MTEVLTYHDEAMDFEGSSPKRQRLDYGQAYQPSIQGLMNHDLAQSSQYHDNITDTNHAELEGAWALSNLSFLNTQSNDFAFSGFEASDLNLTADQNHSFDNSAQFFSDETTFGIQQQDLDMDSSFHHDVLDAPTTVADNLSSELPEVALPVLDQVCYGMIADVPITAAQSSTLNFETGKIALNFSKPNHLYQVGKETIFGELDERNAKILGSLGKFSEEGICFQIYCRTINRRAAQGRKGSRKVGANELQYVMNTIIYGPEDLCDDVGSYLTRIEERIMTDQLGNLNSAAELEKFISQDDIFSELSCDDHLACTEAPEAISTPLYRHQMKALTFMVKREEGWQCDGSQDDLWVQEVDETGQKIYTNMITEMSQKTPPPDSRGGLLADQMGLGKSLTMISLIALNTCNSTEGGIFTTNAYLRRLKSTLIVVPYSLLETWNNQLKRHLKENTLTWMRFHGTQKKKTWTLGNFDIVITTFETLVRQQKRHEDPECRDDTLFSFSWHRIVLDEAHTIRNRSTAMAKAACAVNATNRWAITGTPIQNRVTDFSSLLEYLKIYPFSNPKVFDTEIAKPWLNKTGDKDITRMKKLVNCMSLCRTKAIIDLPRRQDSIRKLSFSPEEQEYYDKVKEGTIRKLDAAISTNPLQPGQYLNALQWLNELRLICNHGLVHSNREVHKTVSIVPQDTHVWNKSTANKAFETIVTANQASCSVCGNVLSDGAGQGTSSENPKPYLAKCLTLTCGSCIKDSPTGQRLATCRCIPLCKSVEVSWTPDVATSVGKGKTLPDVPEEHISTKLKTLLEDLQTCPEGEKSVVFSYWTFTLDLIESLLIKSSISYTRIDGQHSGERREEAIQKFQTDPSIQVILVSITCGGAGLDLTAASVAYLLEPQWNPMMEEQALCRIHRLGQTKEVKTVKYRIGGSFEERVVQTQEMKKEIAAEAFNMESRRNPLDNLKDLRKQLG